MPARRVGAGDVMLDAHGDGATRFGTQRIGSRDSTLRDSIEAEIDVARLRFRLKKEQEDLGGYIAMGLLRISEIRSDGSLILDDNYIRRS